MYNTQLYWDGQKINIKKKEELVKYLETLGPGTWFDIVVTPLGTTNNTSQSKLYFKWRDIIANELGWTGTDMHDYLKDLFNGGKSTKGLDTKGWSQFMLQVSAFAGEHNITLPTGEAE